MTKFIQKDYRVTSAATDILLSDLPVIPDSIIPVSQDDRVEPTLQLRFLNGKLQQLWMISTYVTRRYEWRNVPGETTK